MKVLVISLKRAVERRQFMTKQLQSLGLDFEIIDAVDYQKLSEAEFNKLSDPIAVSQNPCLTKGMIACALSHVKIFEKMIAEDLEKVLVLEDDAHLPDNIKLLMEYIEKNMQEDEVIGLSYYNHSDKPVDISKHQIQELSKINKLVFPVDLHQIASTMAYIIPLSVAKKMSKILMPIRVQPDYWGVYFEEGAFRSFRCLYPVTVKPASFRSTLDYAAGKTLKSKLAAFVRKYKIPILLSYLERRNDKLQEQKYIFNFIEEKPFNEVALQ